MNPAVISQLLRRMEGVASMSWDECEKHNIKYYKEVFIVSKLSYWTYSDWDQVTEKARIHKNCFLMDHNHKIWEELDKHCKNASSTSRFFSGLYFTFGEKLFWDTNWWYHSLFQQMEKDYTNFRSQIKQTITASLLPKVEKTF